MFTSAPGPAVEAGMVTGENTGGFVALTGWEGFTPCPGFGNYIT